MSNQVNQSTTGSEDPEETKEFVPLENQEPATEESNVESNGEIKVERNKKILPIVKVGWLGYDNNFPTGKAPNDCFQRLLYIARNHRKNVTLGSHICEQCYPHSRGIYDHNYQGEFEYFGNGEIWVRDDVKNVMYVAPTMIVHYMAKHAYLPPREFIEAVMRMPADVAKQIGGKPEESNPRARLV
jgi:hypothetical protein